MLLNVSVWGLLIGPMAVFTRSKNYIGVTLVPLTAI